MEDDISMICEIQADKFIQLNQHSSNHSQYQIISQGTHPGHFGNNDSPLGNGMNALAAGMHNNNDERMISMPFKF